MDLTSKENILMDAIDSWKNNKGRFNYMSLKNASTIEELERGIDNTGNSIFVKSNLDKKNNSFWRTI